MKYSGNGTTATVEIASTPTNIPQLDMVGIPSKQAAEIDVTDHSDSVKTFIGDLPENPPIEIGGLWDPEDTTHKFLYDNVGQTLNWVVTVKGASAPTTNDILTFSGTLLSFQPQANQAQGSPLRFSGQIRPNAATVTSTGS